MGSKIGEGGGSTLRCLEQGEDFMQAVQRKSIINRSNEANIFGYLFILPALAFIGLFLVYPAIQLFQYSVSDITFFSQSYKYVGSENFTRILGDSDFMKSLSNSFYFALVVVPVQSGIALILAFLLSKVSKGASVFRTLYFFPVVTSMSLVAWVWKFMYQPDFGLVNSIFEKLGIGSQGLLGDAGQAFNCIILTCIWKSFGWYMVIFFIGILGIPRELYESGMIDGTTPFKEFLFITLPLLRRTMLLVIIMTTMDALKIFTPVFIMTDGSGGPLNSTNVVINYVYNTAFKGGQLGYASSAAVVVFLIILLISAVQFKLLNRED